VHHERPKPEASNGIDDDFVRIQVWIPGRSNRFIAAGDEVPDPVAI
jgi:hypothetical protein